VDDHRDRLARALGPGYELGTLVASGGFGQVFRARDVRLQRHLAVKTLRPDLTAAMANAAERFTREARAMARLEHPNIMPVYAVGEGDGLVFLVMPLIEGPSLRALLDREAPLPLADVRRLLLEIARALDHAHRRGVIHRDIKPENVLLAGEERRVLVTDFGIARALEPDSEMLTSSGLILGTPRYMSPEQASGDLVDARSDIYSLGVLGFEMLTGRLPFEGRSAQTVIVKHLTEPAPPVEMFRDDCPADLSLVVARCLAKDRDHRFGAAAELCHALETEAPAGKRRNGAVSSSAVAAWITGRSTRDPVSRFRQLVALYAGAVVALFGLDLVVGRGMDFAPVGLVVLTVPLFARYAKLWMAGYSWRDMLGLRSATAPGEAPGAVTPRTPTGEGQRFGPYTSRVQRVRAERALVVGLVQRLPKVEREPATRAVSAADRMLAESRALGEQLCRIDRLMAERSARLPRPSAASYGVPQDDLSREAAARREALLRQLAECEHVTEELRVAVERAAGSGVAAALGDLDRAIAAASAFGGAASPLVSSRPDVA
jgi:hypothetical protein